MIQLMDLTGLHPNQQRAAASQTLIDAVVKLRNIKSAEEVAELERAAAIGYECTLQLCAWLCKRA